MGKISIYPLLNVQNPAQNQSHIMQILKNIPIIRDELLEAINGIGESLKYKKQIDLKQLPDNSHISNRKLIELRRATLIDNLEKLANLNNGQKPIIIIMDNCFTNNFLIELLKNQILGHNYFEKFVEIVEYDYESTPDNEITKAKITNNSLVILGGSLADTYSINIKHYESYLSDFIFKTISQNAIENNNRIIGICFGNQFIANILSINNYIHSNISVNIKGPAQFGAFPCEILPTINDQQIYKKALMGLTNLGKCNSFSAIFTRTGHIIFDILGNKRGENIIPLISDKITQNTVGWGTKNGKAMGIQFHPEIELENIEQTVFEISKHVDNLQKDYGKQIIGILKNFIISQTHLKKGIGIEFYLHAINGFIKDIYLTQANYYNKTNCITQLKFYSPKLDYSTANTTLLKRIKKRYQILTNQRHKISDTEIQFNIDNKKELIELLYSSGKMAFCKLDRVIDRGIQQVNTLLGLSSIENLILEYVLLNKQNGNNNYYFKDLGPGNGTLLQQLYNSELLKKKDIIYYGIGNKIYFNLFNIILNLVKKIDHENKIPIDIIKLISQKIIFNLGNNSLSENQDLKRNFFNSLNQITLNPNDTLIVPGVFSNEDEIPLNQQAKQYLNNPKNRINIIEILGMLKNKNIFYNLFEGFFERIYIGDFSSNISDKALPHYDFQIAIRSTSHINSLEFKNLILQYSKTANDGSISIDNGIHQSYTNIPRIQELYECYLILNKIHNNSFDIKLIYDSNTNYFTCAIISKAPHSNIDLNKHLQAGYLLIDIKEAQQVTFFKLERFIRNLIMSSFKDEMAFWYFNKQIVEFLKNSMTLINEKKHLKIKKGIINLINNMVEFHNKKGKSFNKIDFQTLNNYNSDTLDNINEILNQKTYSPIRLNLNANRRY